MALKISTDISVDFYDKKYILVNAKQFDRGSKILDEGEDYSRWLDNGSRFLSVTCYNHGVPFSLNAGEYEAYVRYRKADGYSVFNFCEIDRKGKIMVALTEQMLASDGVCVADLVIVEKGHAEVDPNTCEIININETAVLSTMPIHIDVTEVAVNNSDIESSYEFNLLNTNLEKYWADFEDVMKTSKSWAVGNSGLESRKDIEDTDNSQYYSQMSKSWAVGHTEDNVRTNEDFDNAQWYSGQSESWAIGGTGDRAGEDTNNAQWFSGQSESWAIGGTGNRDGEDTNNASWYNKQSESWAVGGTESRDGEDTNNSKWYSEQSSNSALLSKSYAIGGTDIESRPEEDTDNAEYYSRLAKSYTMGDFDGSTNTRDDESTENAKVYMETTNGYMNTVNGYMNTVNEYMETTDGYMDTTEGYMKTTEGYMGTTEGYMNTVNEYMETTDGYMDTAKSHMDNANAYMTQAQSYTVGGTGTRVGEDTDNASWYYNEMKDMFNGLNIVFVPKGTISFSELATAKETAVAGYVYNIKDDFVTDETFREGTGMTYTAGTNIYYTIDGQWDCFGGSASPTATVDEVKDYLGI